MGLIRIKVVLFGLLLFTANNATFGDEAHIARAKHWGESKNTPISLKEWTDFIKTDYPFLPGHWPAKEANVNKLLACSANNAQYAHALNKFPK